MAISSGLRLPGAILGMLLLAGTLAGTNLAGAGPVNINTADAATLQRELKGVGAKRAQAIVDYRKAHGPFKSADELALVKGIGPAAIEKNRADIRVDAGKCAPGPCGPTVKSNTMSK
jgi:competence protein ComEA